MKDKEDKRNKKTKDKNMKLIFHIHEKKQDRSYFCLLYYYYCFKNFQETKNIYKQSHQQK